MQDLAVVRDFVHTAEELGYTHLRILDHVLGADPQFHPEVPVFYYTHASVTHEPFTLMAYLAALTTRLDQILDIDLPRWTPVMMWAMGCRQCAPSSQLRPWNLTCALCEMCAETERRFTGLQPVFTSYHL